MSLYYVSDFNYICEPFLYDVNVFSRHTIVDHHIIYLYMYIVSYTHTHTINTQRGRDRKRNRWRVVDRKMEVERLGGQREEEIDLTTSREPRD